VYVFAHRLLTFTKQIGSAVALETLTLSRNRFSKLPAAFVKLKALKTLDLSNNRCVYL
jgi:Leucine-rich repeat (LRR) protein